MSRLAAYMIGGLALAVSPLAYMEFIHGLGFPDGFITELGRAQSGLALIFIAISVALGSYFIYLGRAASRRAVGAKLSAALILYFLSVIVIAAAGYYYQLHLTGSSGG